MSERGKNFVRHSSFREIHDEHNHEWIVDLPIVAQPRGLTYVIGAAVNAHQGCVLCVPRNRCVKIADG